MHTETTSGRLQRVLPLTLSLALFCLCGTSLALAAPHAPPGWVTLNVVAYDTHGNPVSDLQANEVRVSDSGKPQTVMSLTLNQTHQREPVVLLFDLLNSRIAGREAVRTEILNYLEHVEAPDNLYLYLLTKHATLFPIRGLQSYEGEPVPDHVPWIQTVRATLDKALNRLNEIRPLDMEDPDYRLQSTVQAFSGLAGRLAGLPGRKSIVWISHGLPIDITYYSGAYAEMISRLCTSLAVDGVAVYAVHESDQPGIHMDSAGFLDEFTGLTGGVTFASDRTEAAVSQALQDDRLNYSLTYTPSNFQLDGKFHKVRLTCTRPGVRLRSVQGYYAIPPPPR